MAREDGPPDSQLVIIRDYSNEDPNESLNKTKKAAVFYPGQQSFFNESGWNRTSDAWLFGPTLYLLSYRQL